MKKIYCVIRQEVVSKYCYVEAFSKTDAEEVAENVESEGWRSNQDYSSEVLEVTEVKDKTELEGRYIETGEGSYRYPKTKIKK